MGFRKASGGGRARPLMKGSGIFALSAVVFGGWLFSGAQGEEVIEVRDPNGPSKDYWVYVLAESSDELHRVRFGPEGIEVEATTRVGRLPMKSDGPHGLAVDPAGSHLYFTTGHGAPDGMFWKYETGTEEQAADPIPLGRFPATLDVTPDGAFAFAVNFNLYGEHVPSTMSVIYTPDVYEVERINLCVMPHGARVGASGEFVYTVCMMDDVLVEVDTRTFEVSRTFSVAKGDEGPVPVDAAVADPGADPAAPDPVEALPRRPAERPPEDPEPADRPEAMEEVAEADEVTCSPTWAHPSPNGEHVYVACNATNTILEISLEDWELASSFETGEGPYNLDFTPDGRLLVATLDDGNAVEFIDLEVGETVARTATSSTVVHGVTVSPDGHYAFVSVEGVGMEPGKVDVFDLETFERVADVEVGQQASGIDFWRMDER